MPLWKRNLFACLFGAFATAAGLSTVLPFMPMYIEQLGVARADRVVQWAGWAFGATYILAALVSPLWGWMADRYGRKPMLLRASLGMAVIMALMGLVSSVWQLVALRFVMGAVAGYVSAANVLVATRTPREHAGWALGVLSIGAVSGNLIGPLIGGWLAELTGLRAAFFVTGAWLFVAFLITWFGVKEAFTPSRRAEWSGADAWRSVGNRRLMPLMLGNAFTLTFASLTIEPIITVYTGQLLHGADHVALLSGLVVSAVGLASMVAAPGLGRLCDRIGPRKVLVGSMALTAAVLVPQAFVDNIWELGLLRFVMGLTLAGMLPGLNSLLRQSVPDEVAGRMFGYMQSAQYLGQIVGPVAGGVIAAHFGLPMVFFATSALLVVNVACNVGLK